jgi:outer membrane lipoprotein LolB
LNVICQRHNAYQLRYTFNLYFRLLNPLLNFTFSLRIPSLTLLGILLAGCAGIQATKPDQKGDVHLMEQHQKEIAQIKQFSLKGRLGLQASGKGFSGQLQWQHDTSFDDVILLSPLGNQVALIKKTAQQVTLTDAKGQTLSAENAETLTEKTLGWQLPLAGLADWSLGKPTQTTIGDSTWDQLGRLTSLKQDGWLIEYQSYTNVAPYALPNRLILRRNQVYLKLIIDDWSDLK